MAIEQKSTPYNEVLSITTEDGKTLTLSRWSCKGDNFLTLNISSTHLAIISLREEVFLSIHNGKLKEYLVLDEELNESVKFVKTGSTWSIILRWVDDNESACCLITNQDFITLVNKFKRAKAIKKHFNKNKKSPIDNVLSLCKTVFMLPSKVFNI